MTYKSYEVMKTYEIYVDIKVFQSLWNLSGMCSNDINALYFVSLKIILLAMG